MEYKITDLLAMAFDIKMPILIPDPATVIKGKIGKGYSLPGVTDAEPAIYYPSVKSPDEDLGNVNISWMGTPIMFPIRFLGSGEQLDKPYRTYRQNGELQEVTMSNFTLPAATITDFSRAKNIVRTEISGSNGTVKELFGFDDWFIRIRGLCMTDNNRHEAKTGQEQKDMLMAWERIAGAIKVEGSLFEEKNIDEIVIESIHIRQLEGRPWAIPFEIRAISNEPVSLIEN